MKNRNTKKRIISIIISVILVAAIIVGVVISQRNKMIPENPSDMVGNTSGNLNNGGYFCEDGDVVYFSNFNDNHYLYKMNPDGTDVALVKDVPVSYINAAGDYLYFYYDDKAGADAKFMGFAGKMSGIYRIRKNGEDLHSLLRCTSGIMNLIGNRIFFEHYDNSEGMTLYYSTLDGKTKEMVMNKTVNPSCAVNGVMYYCDLENNLYLTSYRPGGTAETLITEYPMYDPVYAGGYLYFLNLNDDYCLYRYSLSNNSMEKITGERVDAFNVYEDVIFYQRLKNPALIKVNADGSGAVVVAEGTYSNICCTSKYTYFNPFGEEIVYATPTYGNGQVGTFNP